MANNLRGDDLTGDSIQGFGVCGSGIPSTVETEDGPINANTAGVWGIVGGADDISDEIDFVTNNFKQRATAGVLGVVPKSTPGTPGQPGSLNTVALGFLAGIFDPEFHGPAGAYGESSNVGVIGVSKGATGGVLGVAGLASQAGSDFDPATGGTGVFGTGYVGVRGETQTGVAVMGRTFGPGLAGKFDGDVEVTGDIRLVNKDCAEDFDIVNLKDAEPGTVMVLGQNGALEPSCQAYDKKVAGVISGAGDFRPGIILDKETSESLRMPIALLGKVYCKVDARCSPIEVGDLLTTSATPGHAMKADDPLRALGTLIGKALHPLREGLGMIPILVALQ